MGKSKVTLTNTGPGAFVVTDADGFFVEIPGAAPQPPQLVQPPPSTDEQGRRIYPPQEGTEQPPPANVREVELDDALIEALRKRQEKGSPLQVGGGGPGHPRAQERHAEQSQHELHKR